MAEIKLDSQESFTVSSAEVDDEQRPQTLTLYTADGKRIYIRAWWDSGCGGAFLDISKAE